MTTVTITSDWKNGDYYLGALKGALLCLSSDLRVVDITNSIPNFDVLQEIFILKGTFRHFPKSSIHIMGVMSEPRPGVPMVILYGEGHYFVGLNDGRFSLLFNTVPPICFEILKGRESSGTFSSLELFREAVDIIITNTFEKRTIACDTVKETVTGVVSTADTITGRVLYCDSFGNAVTNIEKAIFDSTRKGRGFTVFVQGPYMKITKIVRGYWDSRPGEVIALFNSLGLLEIAVNQGDVTKLENLTPSSEIRIKFTER
ncbi:MAG: SAM-dependent chlorinase/fluorinase [Bacteroidales bacterium]|jgi:hypothetical protein|nr:SAM-dependent chlorinase/fluorinase [Bacteroidales bacterium]